MARRASLALFLLVLAWVPGASGYVIVIGDGDPNKKKPSLKPLPALPEQRTGNPAGYRVGPAKPPPYGHVIPPGPILPLTGEAPAKSRDTVFFGSTSSQDSRGNLQTNGSNGAAGTSAQTPVGSVGTPWIGGAGGHNRDQGGQPTTGPGSTNSGQGGRPASPTSTPGSVNYSSQPRNRVIFRAPSSPPAPPARPRKWFTPRSYSTGVSRFGGGSYGAPAGAPARGTGRGRAFVGGRKY